MLFVSSYSHTYWHTYIHYTHDAGCVCVYTYTDRYMRHGLSPPPQVGTFWTSSNNVFMFFWCQFLAPLSSVAFFYFFWKIQLMGLIYIHCNFCTRHVAQTKSQLRHCHPPMVLFSINLKLVLCATSYTILLV